MSEFAEQCNGNECRCGEQKSLDSEVSRRLFLGAASAGALVGLTPLGGGLPCMAGPFEAVDSDDALIPADKKLSDEWVASLYARGEPEWFGGEELKHIGMPVGGICCGQVYLSGDGRLWHWDIFNQDVAPSNRTAGPHYAQPMPVESKVDLGFTIRVKTADQETIRSLDQTGFPQVRFRGAYPIGFVDYGDDGFPVHVSLEAFSPFSPLDVDGSSLPLTVMRYTVHNSSENTVEVSLAGSMSNPVLLKTGHVGEADLVNAVQKKRSATCVHFTAGKRVVNEEESPVASRPDIEFDNFESDTYEKWDVEGTAFGTRPVIEAKMPSYQKEVGASGLKLVNSHNTRQGESLTDGDAHVGVMTSKPFTITRHYINALVGGGAKAEQTSLQLLIDGKVAAKMAGTNSNTLQERQFDVIGLEGKTAQLRIVDNGTKGWGNIGVDQIVFSDRRKQQLTVPLDERPDMGDMTLAVLGPGEEIFATADRAGGEPSDLFGSGSIAARSSSNERPQGVVGKTVALEPGERATVSFAISWRFPNQGSPIPAVQDKGHYYAERFPSSLAVVDFHAAEHEESYARTRLWHDTWYDSTLPYWLLDRTFINISILATTTCLRFEGGRFWGWEGVGCCAGTCTHVWHYAQSIGRLFPELERITREKIDYDLSYEDDGRILFRGEGKHRHREAIDGQCGTILRAYREHTMSSDDAFLRRIWSRVKGSLEFLIREDGDGKGVLTGKQMNTLDSAWYGPISWISSLYLASLRAGSQMAQEMGDADFANQCDQIVARGSKWISENLFDGEYFYHQRDPKHPGAIGSGIGCHIDQVMGQGWAHQLGLQRVLPVDKTATALKSLWRYNFAPDVGPYRQERKRGRWYAVAGEAGLIMCTFPKGGEEAAGGGRAGKGFAGYFNECMTGFEYQAAGHMIAEGLVREGLAVTRAIHDRYHSSRRNPYNEIECGDHYARAMASHGVFVSLCGFQYHGPKGEIGFAPRLSPEDFRAPFIGVEGWGTFSQKISESTQLCSLRVNHGSLALTTLSLQTPSDHSVRAVRLSLDGKEVPAELEIEANRAVIRLRDLMTISPGQVVECRMALTSGD